MKRILGVLFFLLGFARLFGQVLPEKDLFVEMQQYIFIDKDSSYTVSRLYNQSGEVWFERDFDTISLKEFYSGYLDIQLPDKPRKVEVRINGKIDSIVSFRPKAMYYQAKKIVKIRDVNFGMDMLAEDAMLSYILQAANVQPCNCKDQILLVDNNEHSKPFSSNIGVFDHNSILKKKVIFNTERGEMELVDSSVFIAKNNFFFHEINIQNWGIIECLRPGRPSLILFGSDSYLFSWDCFDYQGRKLFPKAFRSFHNRLLSQYFRATKK